MRILQLSAVLLALFAAACVPGFRAQLFAPEAAKLDERVVGKWMTARDGETTTIHVLPRSDSVANVLMATSYTAEVGVRGDWTAFTMTSGRIGGHDFASLRWVADSGGSEGVSDRFMLCRYAIDEAGGLRLWTMSPEAAKAALADGLEGEVKGSGFQADVLVTSSPEAVRRYLETHDAVRVFATDVGRFKRQL